MWLLGRRLEREGYRVVNFPYNQASESLDEITGRLRGDLERECGDRCHLVTHSLGGIIARNGFRGEGYPAGLSRIVMLAPPNRPALLAKGLRGNPVYRLWTGDSGQKLGDAEFYAELPAPRVPTGVIAGTGGNRILSEEKNDGVVLVETTRLEGMADFEEVPHSHTFLMNSRGTARLVSRFLRRGSF
jgi:hypothetical protein